MEEGDGAEMSAEASTSHEIGHPPSSSDAQEQQGDA